MTECRNNLKQLELALHNYHDVWETFPPAITRGPDGRPWHSWRVLLLPYLERQDLYDRYRLDEPWNSPLNRQLLAEFPSIREFTCPEERDRKGATCSYFAVVGEKTSWPPDRSVGVEDILDGTSMTLHIVEVSNSGVPWMEPRDLPFDRMTFRINDKKGVGIRSLHGPSGWYWKLYYETGDSAHASNVDGSIRHFEKDTSPETVTSLLIRNDGEPVVGEN